MIKASQLPEKFLTGISETGYYRFGGPVVLEDTLENIEIKILHVGPKTKIKMHGHKSNQWEVLVDIGNKTAYVCAKGREHELVNSSDEIVLVLAITGYSYDSDPILPELEKVFGIFGVSVTTGSLIIR